MTIALTRNHIVGHRGARSEAIENSIDSFMHLNQIKVHKGELDIQLSADNKLIVIHNSNAWHMTGMNLPIADTTSVELQKLNIARGSHAPDNKNHFEPIPLLHEITTRFVPSNDAATSEHLLQIEVKRIDDPQKSLKMAQVLYQECLRLGLTQSKSVVITSFDTQFLKYSIPLNPIPHGFIASGKTEITSQFLPYYAASIGCKQIVLEKKIFNREMAARCKNLGLPVSIFTVNKPKEAEALAKLGADYIITDKPKTMLEWIEENSKS